MWLLASVFWGLLQVVSKTEWGASVLWNFIVSLIVSPYLCLLVPRWVNRCPRCRPAPSSCSSSSSWRDRPEASAGTVPLIFWCLVERAGDGVEGSGKLWKDVRVEFLDTLRTKAGKDKKEHRTQKKDSLSTRQISATVLKTTLEKLTVILTVFMLGSCSSRGLCWGV